MDSDQIYFDEIKREVLPDGRIRYSAEKIVTEVEIEAPHNQSEVDAFFARVAAPLREAIFKEMMNDPYLKLLEGSDMASNEA